MIISFDLDDTLIPSSNSFECEQSNILGKLLGLEPLRKGTKELFKLLKNEGHEIWIYTTSYRSKNKIKWIFGIHGLFPQRIINQTINAKLLKKFNCYSSKNPSLFGIDLHIDDAKGVKIESEKDNSNVLIILPENNNWVIEIMNSIAN